MNATYPPPPPANNLQSTSWFARLRSNLTALEAVELPLLIAGLYTPIGILYTIDTASEASTLSEGLSTAASAVWFGFAALVAGLFLWGVYLLYIRIARWGGPAVDVGLWLICSLATATFTFWCWTVLDINRWIIAKLLYRGEAPVEFAWSAPSKRRRKDWEAARKAAAYVANMPG